MNEEVSGKFLKRMYEAMLFAFPEYNEYRRFLRLNLNAKLDDIVSSKKMSDVHFDVLEWFERDGRLDLLLNKAIEERSQNEDLVELLEEQAPRPAPAVSEGGAQIEQYQILRILGSGRVSIVYEATDNLGRPVVIKVLDRLFSTNEDWRENFALEAQIMAQLQHEAIVPIFQYGEHEDEVFMVLPYMSGGNLLKRVHKALPLANVVHVYQRIGSAVDYIHHKGIVHQNIKPENILFDDVGLAHLADFGMARLVESTPAETQVSDPLYLSPEQFVADYPADIYMDVYALGVMLYESLAGEPPFQGFSRKQLQAFHTSHPVPDILQMRPDLPAGLQPIIERAMAKDPTQRFGNAGELSLALQELV